ncbi:BsuPI-related putative proteinase inhibitor [Bacillus sp. NEB1478]|uniref:BsuPI-related putative proteinase inhibitor n=1 Tax=Bacillus sp. NEB1478 TaxID=3073816 RepID=UPI0028737A90|nr:BsuPI-related putative proteinase inhibitor [Bacillus sp. NEB1478]WNB90638.1 BsuPI-related putative proteinase inhibitor [Bacillus sp. NEB1478]
MKRWGSLDRVVPIFLLALLFTIFSGCVNDKDKKQTHKQQVSSQLSPVLSIQQRNEEISFLIALENNSNHTVTLTFPTSKMFDITVTDTSGKKQFRHTDNKQYSENPEKVAIKAGDSHIWTSSWKLAPGRNGGIYKVNAEVLPEKISPGSLKTETLTMEETLTLQSPAGKLENNSFRNIHFTGTDGKYKVTGEARVFEAAFAYTVTDGHQVFDEQHKQASAGAPAWATFSFDVHIPEDELPINGTLILELYYFSPKDGSKTDVLAIPLQTFK